MGEQRPYGRGQPSGEDCLDYFRDEAANKWRGTFESPTAPTVSTPAREMTQLPSTYEQAKAMGMQTAPTPASDMHTTKDQDPNGQTQTSAFTPASPQQIVIDLNRSIAYTQKYYDGDPAKTYWANRGVIDAQIAYNDKRNAAGLKPLVIADFGWDPRKYDDATNEWIAKYYQQNGSLPDPSSINPWAVQAAQVADDLAQHVDYAGTVYGGDPATAYWSNRDVIDAQFDDKGKHNAADQSALQNSGGPSQLASDASPGQPIAYEQTRAPGTQTSQTKTSAVTTAKDQDSGGVRSAWVNALDQFLPESIFPEASLPAQTDIPAWMPKWLLQAADTAKVLNRALPNNLVTNYLLGTLPTAIKSAYLNSVAAGANVLAGKPVEYTPDMTMADYTAQEARKLNVMDPLAEANKISPWLGIPASILAEGLSDPTTFVGLGELQALGRGGKALKFGTADYEAALRANKLNGGLTTPPKKLNPRAEALEQAKESQLADEMAQGYTQNNNLATDDVLKDGPNEPADSIDFKQLNTYGDALREKLGPAYSSHKAEYDGILKEASERGVEVIFRKGTLAYEPSLSAGKPGRLILDPEASIGALRHEFRHLLDDATKGHPGFSLMADRDAFWRLEYRGYMEELQLARQLKDKKAEELIVKEMEARKKEIFGGE